MTQLPLPISPADALTYVIVPALAELGSRYDTPSARVMLLAIALQESGLAYRHQVGGPAHGLWQFEQAGGVRGVLNYSTTQSAAAELCDLHGVAATEAEAFAALETDDVLAAGFARLLLYTLPQALPALGDADEAWDQYIDAWRPGEPHPDQWASNYATALETVQ